MQRLRLIPLVLALAVVVAWAASSPDPAAANGCPLRDAQGVEGDAADPILIADRAALTTLATESSCFESPYVFRQTADIDLSGAAWGPIAAGGAFRGTYDGRGHRITGLDVSVSSGAAGLFSIVQQGTVRDLVLVAPRVVGTELYTATGALAAYARVATVERVRVEGGSVHGLRDTGGLVGELCLSRLVGSSSSAAVSGRYYTGGLVGAAASQCVTSADVGASINPDAGVISDASATGAVSGEDGAGGLIGRLDGFAVERSFATGQVTVTESVAGGLVGRATGITDFALLVEANPAALTDVYATGAVAAARGGVGGLVGLAGPDLVVTRAYATGRVSGTPEAGGLVGGEMVGCGSAGASLCSADSRAASAPAPTSFWDAATTGQPTSYGGVGTAKTTAEMHALATYAGAGWPIVRGFSSAAGTTWGICPSANGGYPFLQNRYSQASPPCAGTPTVPLTVRLTPGDGTLTVTWSAPASDGGSPVTSYSATAQMQRQSAKAAPGCTAAGTATSCTITGLRNGRSYRVVVNAGNIEGTGASASAVGRPERSLVVLSTRRSGLEVVTRVWVRSAGRITQVGRTAGVAGAVCTASARPAKAGIVELTCTLSARAERALAGRALAVRVATTFRPASGPTRATTRTVAFARITAAAPVTG